MCNAAVLYRVVSPGSIGSHTRLVCYERTAVELDDERSWSWLHAWALTMLAHTGQRFGMYQVALMPLNQNGTPDEETFLDLMAADVDVLEDYLCWSGESELVPA